MEQDLGPARERLDVCGVLGEKRDDFGGQTVLAADPGKRSNHGFEGLMNWRSVWQYRPKAAASRMNAPPYLPLSIGHISEITERISLRDRSGGKPKASKSSCLEISQMLTLCSRSSATMPAVSWPR